MTKQEKKAEALAKLDQAARNHQRQNPSLTYSQCYAKILEQHPLEYNIVRNAASIGIR